MLSPASKLGEPPRIKSLPLPYRAKPFDHPKCLYELKYDGFRAIAYLEHGQKGDAVGRPRWRSSFLGDPGAKFLVETGHHHRTNEKLTKFREHLSQSRSHH